MKQDLFEGVFGQEKAKLQLNTLLDSFKQSKFFPHTIYTAARGSGKTTLARETAKHLYEFDDNGQIIQIQGKKGLRPKCKTFIEINCASLKSLNGFINSLVQNVQGRNVTLLFDEASEIPPGISTALLTILNPNVEKKTTYIHDEYILEFDFRKQTFLFATAEPQKINHMLMDRLNRIDLEEYSLEDLGKIVQKGASNISFENNLLPEIATVLRGNPRQAMQIAEKIQIFLKSQTTFSKTDWEETKRIFSINPLGLNTLEVQILKNLATKSDGTSLTCLAAQVRMSRESLQHEYELTLLAKNLMQVGTKGREITKKGLEYLREISGIKPPDNNQFKTLNVLKEVL
jgi:Holliday junction resolvasome RuvABC ATP-dependent DNA helicase subunit